MRSVLDIRQSPLIFFSLDFTAHLRGKQNKYPSSLPRPENKQQRGGHTGQEPSWAPGSSAYLLHEASEAQPWPHTADTWQMLEHESPNPTSRILIQWVWTEAQAFNTVYQTKIQRYESRQYRRMNPPRDPITQLNNYLLMVNLIS